MLAVQQLIFRTQGIIKYVEGIMERLFEKTV